MPLYEYRCAECGTTVERFKPSARRDYVPSCVNSESICLGMPMDRVLTPPAIRGETVARS